MSWGLWDDQTAFDPKWLGLSNDATALGFRAATWSRGPWAGDRPGFATLRQLRALAGSVTESGFRRALDELQEVGLLEQTTDGGFFVHGPRNTPSVRPPQVEPPPTPGSKLSRSEAGKLGGAKSAESRRNHFGSAQPAPKQTPKHPEANSRSTSEAPLEADPEAPRSKPETTEQVASKHPIPIPKQHEAAASKLSGSAPEATRKQSAAASESASKQDREQSQRLPSNLEEALELAICVRADVALTHPERAEWLQPHKWPEVLAVATELHTAAGLGEVRLGTYHRDSGVRAVVELFGAGYMPGDLKRAARALAGEPWWTKDGAKRGLASLTPEVVRRALASGLSPAQEARIARALGERPPSALGSLLPKVAGAEPT